MIPGMYASAFPDYDPITGQPTTPRPRIGGYDPSNPLGDLPGIATGQPLSGSGAAPFGAYSTPAPAAAGGHDPWHALAADPGAEARKEEARRKQDLLDLQANQPNPMTMPLSSFGANRSPLPPAVGQVSALGILGPAIFNALGSLFGQKGGEGMEKQSSFGSDDGPQYGGLY